MAINNKIDVRNLKKSFSGKEVIKGASFFVNEGEIYSIIGKSGTGKSVILKHLIGLLIPDSGGIFVDNIEYTGAGEKTRREIESKYGILFQGAALFDSMNVYDNVAFGLRRMNTAEDEIREKINDIFMKLGLKKINEKLPHELSGGVQKRVGLARSIVLKPEIMLYDEPTTGVDPILASAVNDLISMTRDSLGITSIVVTHDIKSAVKISDRISMLFDGSVIFTGTPEEMRETDDPYVRQFVKGTSNGPIKTVD